MFRTLLRRGHGRVYLYNQKLLEVYTNKKPTSPSSPSLAYIFRKIIFRRRGSVWSHSSNKIINSQVGNNLNYGSFQSICLLSFLPAYRRTQKPKSYLKNFALLAASQKHKWLAVSKKSFRSHMMQAFGHFLRFNFKFLFQVIDLLGWQTACRKI